VTVRAAEASAALPELAQGAPTFDAVLVDPPRRGLAPELRAALAGAAPRAIAYVSCDVATLARDLAAFRWLGYATARLEPLDMIPLSAEVETFALLVPAPAPAPRVLHADGELLAVDKPPHLPTTPQGEHARSLLDAVRKLPGGAAAVPLHRLDLGTSGVCLFARSAEVAGALARAFTEGRSRKTYLALVRGMTQPRGSIRRPLEDEGRMREAATRYRRVAVVAGHSLLEVEPAEGRRHQIRRHLASIGHPVVGDARWGDAATNRHFEARYGLDRTFLHCRRIELARAAEDTRAPLVLESELAGDLAAVEARACATAATAASMRE
ncbi:MAG: RNA methyltransferase, partial [Myxococcales bacterium]|nr:RNA methyltransferase [Myxococcales bacterium]